MNKLEAVNLMLAGIGEDPVNSLSSGNPDAAAAEIRLSLVRKDVLAQGWHCNTRENQKYAAGVDGRIRVAGNVLGADAVGMSADFDVILQGSLLVDRTKNTEIFPVGQVIHLDLTLDIEFDILTYKLRRYIAARAAREYQSSVMGSGTLDAFTSRDEALALQDAQAEDLAARDINLLRQNPNSGYRRRYRRR